MSSSKKAGRRNVASETKSVLRKITKLVLNQKLGVRNKAWEQKVIVLRRVEGPSL